MSINMNFKESVMYMIWLCLLLGSLFVFIIHLKCVPYSNICSLTLLFGSASILEVFELVARMENWKCAKKFLFNRREKQRTHCNPIDIRHVYLNIVTGQHLLSHH